MISFVFNRRIEPVGDLIPPDSDDEDEDFSGALDCIVELPLGLWVEFELPYDHNVIRPHDRIRRTIIGYVGDDSTDVSGVTTLPFVSPVTEGFHGSDDNGSDTCRLPRQSLRHQRGGKYRNHPNQYARDFSTAVTVICPFSWASDEHLVSLPSPAPTPREGVSAGDASPPSSSALKLIASSPISAPSDVYPPHGASDVPMSQRRMTVSFPQLVERISSAGERLPVSLWHFVLYTQCASFLFTLLICVFYVSV